MAVVMVVNVLAVIRMFSKIVKVTGFEKEWWYW
jgi:hypothetical protein